MKRSLRIQYFCAVYHITCKSNAIKYLSVLMLALIVSMFTIVSTTEAIQYDWNEDDEGFVSFQEPWSRSVSSWGGSIGGGSYSARMLGITGLGDTGSISEFITFMNTVSSAENDLIVTIDVYKESSSGWKPPTGQQLPPFNGAFDNSYSSLVMVWLYDGAYQHSFGSELNDADGWESNIHLDYLGSRLPPRHPYTHGLLIKSELEVRLQTYQGESNGFANYQIDNLSITSAGVAPEPVSALLFITGGTLLAGRRYIIRMKV